ncbi:phospholipid/cholesterol/gamma-HCH transport system substrate-binding protein [Salipiger thiooxidans]|uniref:Phospholipid/cholesterol/gamma-HCH transport system substrate-binding protein n=1 Tax=Salipiger thiooxidans TaxID=282683 RepID=A0A1G7MD67_9RHOB|nr:MlaD family protein [Salipiger thiooxidans]SDF59110.1 phospholipid/cholesterol/gamma-HCH transport system substrate-binding protein [Salipiger thiooxidans]
METRARYLLVGLFTIVGLVAVMGFTLWLAKVQIDRTYAQYDIVFDSVAGLGQASTVRYNGVEVGKVLSIALDRDDPALVRVRIEIYASTPVREDTLATLSSQGVTGVSFVALAGGRADAEPIGVVPPADVSLIPSEPSAFQNLLTDAPDVLAEAILLMRDIRSFTTPENGAAITAILRNVETATARIDAMATRTESVMASAEVTMANASATLVDLQALIASADGVLVDDLPAITDQLGAAVDRLGRSAAGFETFANNGLPQFSALATEARAMVAHINALTSRIASDPGRFLLGNQTPTYRN